MRLSVVVTIVDAGGVLERCLSALAAQVEPPELEVIVPWDDTVSGIPGTAARFPAFRFERMGSVATTRPPGSAAGQHQLFDRRRAAGLSVATGDIVAILEDRSVPRTDWARTMVRVHQALPNGVIGGAIENDRDALLNWAVYFCDFGRYQLPFEAGPRAWVSDVNVGYKRRVLDQTRPIWQDRYHETTVHWAVQRGGEKLYLTPDLVVDQVRGELRLAALFRERFAWGRVFAHTRARESTWPIRIAMALLSPLLPVLLLGRHAGRHLFRPVCSGRFLKASSIVFLLLVAWSAGEAVGYLTAES